MSAVKGLNTYQLDEALRTNLTTKPHYDGIYAVDKLGDIKHRPHMIIVNTDPHYMPGQHWLLLNFIDNGTVEMFDSLGKDMTMYSIHLKNFIKLFATHVDQIPYRIQPVGSALCGHYCLYYAYFCSLGERMQDILDHIPTPDRLEHMIHLMFNIVSINSSCQSCKFN